MAGEAKGFYITLPSNLISPSGNKANHFSTKLASELDLKGKWECGISEITFRQNWKISDEKIMVRILVQRGNPHFTKNEFDLFLPTTIYSTPHSVLIDLFSLVNDIQFIALRV